MRVAEAGYGLFGDGGAQMLGDALIGGEGQDGESGESGRLTGSVAADLNGEAVPALVDGLNAVFQIQVGAQGGDAFGYAIGGDVDVAPDSLLELEGGNDFAGMGEEEAESRQLPGGQVNGCVAPEKGAVQCQTKASKRETFRLYAGKFR